MKNSDMLKPSLRKRQKRRDKRMGEELIECYRNGGYWTGNKRKGYIKNLKHQDFEGALKKESIKLRSGGTKMQTDNLKPLIRFLEKHQGKFWNKVYAELCQKMDKKTLLGQHLFDHLDEFVETKVTIESGKIIGHSRYFGGSRELISYYYPQFYVHPKSGQLMKVKKKWNSN